MSSNNAYVNAHVVTAGSMTGTSAITSLEVNLARCERVSIQCVWTGTPNGTFAFQVSNGLDSAGNGITWVAVTLDTTLSAATGTASNNYGQWNIAGAAKCRVVYTNTSSTGTLDIWIVGKGS